MIRVVVGDLAGQRADAIVRPATASLAPCSPRARRLEAAGGPDFFDRIRLRRELAVGAAVVTAAGGAMPAQFLIHTIVQSDAEPATGMGVARAWRSALQQAREWEFATLAVPPLGVAAGGLAIEDAADILVTVLAAHRETAAFPTDVSFVVDSDEERTVFEAALSRGGPTG